MAEQKRGPGRPPGSKNKNTTAGRKTTASHRDPSPKKTGKGASRATALEDPSKKRLHDEIAALVIFTLGVFLIIALQTQLAGAVGTAIGGFLKGLFGFGACILPYFLILYAVFMLLKIAIPFRGKTVVLLLLLFIAIDLINAGRFVSTMEYGLLGVGDVFDQGKLLANGGVFGMYVGGALYQLIGRAGLYLLSTILIVVCLLLLVDTPLSSFFERARVRNEARRQRREEAEERERQEEEERRLQEEEFSAKQDAVKKAGRETQVDYRPPSSRAADFNRTAELFTQRDMERAAAARFGGKAYRRMSDNRKKILGYMLQEDEQLFGKDITKDGYGLDGTQPESIKQETAKGEIWEIDRRGAVPANQVEKWMAWAPGEEASLGQKEAPRQGQRTELPDPGNWETASPEPSGYQGFVPDSKLNQDYTPPEEEDVASPGISAKERQDIQIGGESVATQASATETGDSAVSVTPQRRSRYKFPGVDLLDPPQPKAPSQAPDASHLREKAELLESTLMSFGVEAKVVNVITGPSVTRYEIEPAKGVKVSRITNLSDDLALNMRAKSIRIEAPIPGKAAVGIEIENENREMVGVREIIESTEFRNHKSKLAFTVGRDIGGKSVVADIGKMPHMLIAGATGSGKSVCINSIIISLLYKAKPEEVKLVLVDPKMVELGNYNGIPHLLIPVVTDATKAASALQWAVAEMTDRYNKFAKNGVREIGAYNSKMRDEGDKEAILPQIVIIIDELADLMMVASSQVEDAICRLAQLARAAGMHLILATQRPSVDVITGLIKANVPSRIAFMVSSQIDSRTIIDMAGAEKLVGNGDMLFKPQDLNKPKRIQGPFVSDDEVARVIDFVKSQGEAQYNEEVIEQLEKGTAGGIDDSEDDLLMDAIETVVDAGQASVSMLQRRFRIGYNRAARIVDALEAQGIIGPADGSKPRTVLLTREQWEQQKQAE